MIYLEEAQEAYGKSPRPVHVGNPDVVAPGETGFSFEPDHVFTRWATPPVQSELYGKPYSEFLDSAFRRLGQGDRS